MKKLLIICGGQSTEHIISRMSCTSVLKNINKEKYDITLAGIEKDGTWYILNQTQDDLVNDSWLEGAVKVEDVYGLLRQQEVVYPVLHGMYGEDERFRDCLNLLRSLMLDVKFLGQVLLWIKYIQRKFLKQ